MDFISDYETSSDYIIVPNVNIQSIINRIKMFLISDNEFSNINIDAEIAEIKKYKSIYFIKLRDGSGTIQAVLFNYVDNITQGDIINTCCRIDIYNNQIQLVIKKYIKIGSVVENRFDIIKKKAEDLGYMENKPIIRQDYDAIGIITSITAAGFRDFIHIFNNRYINKKIYIYPSSMQGKSAPGEISDAINLANKHGQVEIISIIRGGGAKEDLECFNSIDLAKSIYSSKIPIVTGIGHQYDISIADLVSAKYYITPTALAQNISQENIHSINQILNKRAFIKNTIQIYMDMTYEYIIESEKNIDYIMLNKIETYQSTFKFCISKYIRFPDDLYNYIMHVESVFDDNIKSCIAHGNSKLNSGLDKLKLYKAEIDKTINIYSHNHNIVSSPYITDINNNIIRRKSDMKPRESYTINFVDGKTDFIFNPHPLN